MEPITRYNAPPFKITERFGRQQPFALWEGACIHSFHETYEDALAVVARIRRVLPVT